MGGERRAVPAQLSQCEYAAGGLTSRPSWLAVPLIGFDGQNYGFIQASDRLEGDFTEQDEANLVRLATLTSAARDGLAQLHLLNYQDKVGT